MAKYGLLGRKLSHSFSPLIHSFLADYEYLLYEKEPQEVGEFVLTGPLEGMNVTIPYKKDVLPYCQSLSESAKRIGCVNTIKREKDGSLTGHNTDYYGFSYMLDKMALELSGKKSLVLGSGGASLTVRAVLEDRGAGEVVVISRGGKNNYENISRHADAGIIVNTTPVGMYPNNGISPVNLDLFPNCEAVLDLIYNPAKTALMFAAAERSIPCINGLSMLVAQAKQAAEIFLSRPLDDALIEKITDSIQSATRNIVLIGMPGCGKTCTGAELARITGRRHFDTDRMIEERTGRSIPDIFEKEGEDYFRSLETDVLREASAGSAGVISTGGGIVKRAENLRLIRQNGAAVFLEREIGELSSGGRPLSIKTGVQALAEERLPLYQKWADYTVCATGIESTAQRIKELLGI